MAILPFDFRGANTHSFTSSSSSSSSCASVLLGACPLLEGNAEDDLLDGSSMAVSWVPVYSK